MSFSSHHIKVLTIDTIYHFSCWSWLIGWGSICQISLMCSYSALPCLSILHSLEESQYGHLTLGGSHSLKVQCLYKVFGIVRGRFVSSSFICLFMSVWFMGIYFICWVITSFYFILLLKLFQFLCLSNLSVGSDASMMYSINVDSFICLFTCSLTF